MDCERIIAKRLTEHLDTIRKIHDDAALQATIRAVVDDMVACFRRGGKIYFCGNGGSAADAQHLAAEFSGRFYLERPILPAEALHGNSSYVTAISNDYSFDIVYARLIGGLGSAGDILVGLSTSGMSKNVVAAFEVCRAKGINTVGFTGADGGKMRALSDRLINVPATDTARIQEAHITIGHIICEMVEATLFSNT